jgi:predicted nucleic acid-binding protein
MKVVYIDHQLITAFFLKNHIWHNEAYGTIASLMAEKAHVTCSIIGIYETADFLVSELANAQKAQFLPKNIDVEKNAIDKINSFLIKLNLEVITTTNDRILSQAIALKNEYGISFRVAFFTSIMLEHKINHIATSDEGFNPLFSEGLLVRYSPSI